MPATRRKNFEIWFMTHEHGEQDALPLHLSTLTYDAHTPRKKMNIKWEAGTMSLHRQHLKVVYSLSLWSLAFRTHSAASV